MDEQLPISVVVTGRFPPQPRPSRPGQTGVRAGGDRHREALAMLAEAMDLLAHVLVTAHRPDPGVIARLQRLEGRLAGRAGQRPHLTLVGANDGTAHRARRR